MREILIGLALIALILSGCGIFQEVEEPSATLEAIPLELEETATVEETAAESTPELVQEATESPPEEPEESLVEEAPTEVAEEEASASGGLVLYSIMPEQSEVRFELDEDLRGNRITVVGSTNQVAGQLAIDLADLSATQVGIIQINARTLTTDNNFRNQAINNEILDTGEYEFITFEPTSIEGLPDSAEAGETIEFSIVGTLTIRDITQNATFDVVATAVSQEQIMGSATSVINREDFGLNIPSVPSVANVEEEVELYINFTAATVQ